MLLTGRAQAGPPPVGGRRVVLVVATAGGAGLSEVGPGGVAAAPPGPRVAGLAGARGCAGLVRLSYADSGIGGAGAPGRGREWFADAEVDVAAAWLARGPREEEAAVLTVYDPRGGHGHPDHLQVHRVGVRAAELAGTAPRSCWRRPSTATCSSWCWPRRAWPVGCCPAAQLLPGSEVYTPWAETCPRVDVRPRPAVKRATMAVHASRTSAGKDREHSWCCSACHASSYAAS